MELLERDGHDHPDFDGLLPRIGCQVCGRNVQTEPEDRGAARAAWQAPADDKTADRARVAFLEPMAAWSREHAATHSPEEHRLTAERPGA